MTYLVDFKMRTYRFLKPATRNETLLNVLSQAKGMDSFHVEVDDNGIHANVYLLPLDR